MKKSIVLLIIFGLVGIFCCSCGFNKNDNNEENKTSIELKHFEKEVSNAMEMIAKVGDYKVKENESKVKSEEQSSNSGEEGEKSDSKGSKSGSSEENTDSGSKVTVMEYQYQNSNGNISDDEWRKIEELLMKIKTSWTALEDDLNSKLGEEKFSNISMDITNNIQNMLVDASKKSKEEFTSELINLHTNIINVAEHIDIEKNDLYLMKVKSKLYESYTLALTNDWAVSKNKIELAKNYLEQVDNVRKGDFELFNTIKLSTESMNKEKYIVAYNEIIENLKNYEN